MYSRALRTTESGWVRAIAASCVKGGVRCSTSVHCLPLVFAINVSSQRSKPRSGEWAHPPSLWRVSVCPGGRGRLCRTTVFAFLPAHGEVAWASGQPYAPDTWCREWCLSTKQKKWWKSGVSCRVKVGARFQCVSEELGGRKTIILHSYSPGYKLLFHINYVSDGHIQNASLYNDIKHIVIIKNKMDPF